MIRFDQILFAVAAGDRVVKVMQHIRTDPLDFSRNTGWITVVIDTTEVARIKPGWGVVEKHHDPLEVGFPMFETELAVEQACKREYDICQEQIHDIIANHIT